MAAKAMVRGGASRQNRRLFAGMARSYNVVLHHRPLPWVAISVGAGHARESADSG